MRPPCYSLLEEIVKLGVVYGTHAAIFFDRHRDGDGVWIWIPVAAPG